MILIIGAGLSGLLTGYRLKKEGIPFKILEARNRVGGRIKTVFSTNNTALEMGATWFTHQHKNVIALLEELKIDYFEQHIDNPVFFQASTTSPIQSIQIPNQAPSYRISGGTSNITNTLLQKLNKEEVFLNQSVQSITFDSKSVQVFAKDTFESDSIVLALPPKLWSKKITFEPTLPDHLMTVANHTHTWMEDSIKVALTYPQPFWQRDNRSGTFFSNSGPITEFYDHCNREKSKYALCGFMNSAFKKLTSAERRTSVLNQIKQVFGEQGEEFMDYEECIWSKEENTFVAYDVFLSPHQNNGHPIFSNSFFEDRLFISGSESALEFPGYMDGAIYSGNAIAKRILKAQHRVK